MKSAFVSAHRNRLDTKMEINIDLISVTGSNLPFFVCGIEIDLVFVWRSKLTRFLYRGQI